MFHPHNISEKREWEGGGGNWSFARWKKGKEEEECSKGIDLWCGKIQ